MRGCCGRCTGVWRGRIANAPLDGDGITIVTTGTPSSGGTRCVCPAILGGIIIITSAVKVVDGLGLRQRIGLYNCSRLYHYCHVSGWRCWCWCWRIGGRQSLGGIFLRRICFFYNRRSGRAHNASEAGLIAGASKAAGACSTLGTACSCI